MGEHCDALRRDERANAESHDTMLLGLPNSVTGADGESGLGTWRLHYGVYLRLNWSLGCRGVNCGLMC
jgi:hypothetical protein